MIPLSGFQEPPIGPSRSRRLIPFILGVGLLSGCWLDGDGLTGLETVAEQSSPERVGVALRCEVDLRASVLECASPEAELPAGASGLIVGGQDEYVTLRSSNLYFHPALRLFQADVTVQNLLHQALGTADGMTESGEGVRVFYHKLPWATVGAGVVEVLGHDGVSIFAGTEQPYYQYELIEPGEESAVRTWYWSVPMGVDAFEFSVFVAAEVPYPDGWVDVDTDYLLVSTDEFDHRITAIARGPLDGQGRVVWQNSDPSVVTVDEDGKVTPLRPGTAVLTVSAESDPAMTPASVRIVVVDGSRQTDAIGIAEGSWIAAAPGSGLDAAIGAAHEVTIETWFRAGKEEGPDRVSGPILSRVGSQSGAGTGTAGFTVQLHRERIQLTHYAGNSSPSGQLYSPANSSRPGAWHHLTLVTGGEEDRIYLDGELVATQPNSLAGVLEDGNFRLGCADVGGTGSCDEFFEGELDDVRVWGKALDSQTIQEWYARPLTSSHPDFESLLVYWSMDEGDVGQIADLSGKDRPGEFHGGAPIWGPREGTITVSPTLHYFRSPGETVQLDARLLGVSGEISYSSNAPAIATVDADGLVTAGGTFGRTEIVLSAPDAPSTMVTIHNGPTFVDASATGANHGGDWANAFTDLQDALALDRPAHEIWVAAGTYYPGSDQGDPFYLKNGVEIYGGFAGHETSREERQWWANETILSGDLGVPGDFSDNSFVVVYAMMVDSTAVLDGFTVTGAANGGIWAYEGHATFRNLIVRGNRGAAGAGIAIEESSPTVVNSVFAGNVAEYSGGAVEVGWGSRPVFINVTFHGNHSNQAGGAISVLGSSPGDPRNASIELLNTIVWGNTADLSHLGEQIYDVDGTLVLEFVVLQGDCPAGASCTMVIDADPLFVDPLGPDGMAGTADDDLRLQPGSPAIDIGHTLLLPAGSEVRDLGGQNRVVGPRVDAGAFEFQGVGGFGSTGWRESRPLTSTTFNAVRRHHP